MNQLQFTLDLPLARSSDPVTSFQSADRVAEFRESQERLIVSVLAEYGPLGVDGIASRCKLTGHAVGKRLVKLQRENRITLTGRIVKSTSGRNEREWRVASGNKQE